MHGVGSFWDGWALGNPSWGREMASSRSRGPVEMVYHTQPSPALSKFPFFFLLILSLMKGGRRAQAELTGLWFTSATCAKKMHKVLDKVYLQNIFTDGRNFPRQI